MLRRKAAPATSQLVATLADADSALDLGIREKS
jgi:hypothetical protein